MTLRQRRVKADVKVLQKYMNTYDTQEGYTSYSLDTVIDDVLYGLGIALDRRRYSFAHGYRKFRARLMKKLEAMRDSENAAQERVGI